MVNSVVMESSEVAKCLQPASHKTGHERTDLIFKNVFTDNCNTIRIGD